MKSSTDQLGRTHQCEEVPSRIVSLVPSITELLCTLGLRDRLVGCTKFCVHPRNLRRSVAVVGGTKNVRVDEVNALKPDLVLASKEENVREQVEQIEAPVWVSDVVDIPSSLELVTKMGQLFDVQNDANGLRFQLEWRLNALKDSERGRVLYFIWREPYMSVGGDTYIHAMLEHLGYENLLAGRERYPQLTASAIQALSPDLILLSSEPYPFKEEHLREFQELYPNAKVRLVDGEFYSWYGSRLLSVLP